LDSGRIVRPIPVLYHIQADAGEPVPHPRREPFDHSGLMFAPLISGHYFSISAF
jgi:hypothetical protein